MLVADFRGRVVSTLSHGAWGSVGRGRGTAGRHVSRDWGGHERDGNTGFVYMGARYYDPRLARFISADPARQASSSYAALGGAPLAHVDPDGRSWRIGFRALWLDEARERSWFAAGVGATLGATAGIVVPADNWGDQLRQAVAGLVGGAIVGGFTGAAYTGVQAGIHYRDIMSRRVSGHYPIVLIPRGSSAAGLIDQGMAALGAFEHFRIPVSEYDRHVFFYDQVDTIVPPRTWDSRLVLTGHADGEAFFVADGREAVSTFVRGVRRGRGRPESAQPQQPVVSLDGEALAAPVATSKRELRHNLKHIDVLGCDCGPGLARELQETLAAFAIDVSVRGARGEVPRGTLFAAGPDHIPLPENFDDAPGPWMIYR